MTAAAQLFDALGAATSGIRTADTRIAGPALVDRARRYAAGLRALGVEPGDRVAALAHPSVDLVVANLGCYVAGAVHVPINTRYRGAEIAHILADSGARAIAADAAGHETLAAVDAAAGLPRIGLDGADGDWRPGDAAPLPSPSDRAPALLIYTSGTTGKSKGVELSFGAIVGNMDALTRAWGWTAGETLSLMLPLFHVHGLCIGVHGAILRGVDILLHRGFSAPALVADVRDRGATIFMGVPTMYRFLLEHLEAHPDDAAALARARLFTSGSAPLPADDFDRFRQLTGHAILERYGMTETLITLSNPLDGERRPGSVGMPVPGCKLRIVGDDGAPCPPGTPGELQVRGISLMTGYFGAPEATAREYDGGWFRTGDVAAADPDGYLRIVGRTSTDIIKSGGFKIAAREIEEVIARHPAVREVAVYGAPDPTWGQAVAVAVVPAAGTDPDPSTLLAELAALVTDNLADYKKPRRLQLLAELPRNALGKLQKHRLG